jgi:hypothetical protein
MIAVVVFVLLAVGAGDDEKVEQARKYFEAGKQAYEAGMFVGAASAFEEAYQLAPRPQVAFSLAQAYRRQYFIDKDPQNASRAVDYLHKYVAAVAQGGRRGDALQFLAELEPIAKRAEEERRRGAAPVAPSHPKVEPTQLMVSSRTKDAVASIDASPLQDVPLLRDVAAGKHKVHVEAPGYYPEEVEELAVDNRLVVVELSLREKPARIVLQASDGAEVAVNGRPVGTTPLPHVLEVPAGQTFLALTHRGAYPFARELDLGRDQEVKIEAPLETTTQRKVAWGFLVGGSVVAAAGATTSVLAYLAQKTARDQDVAITRKLEMGTNAVTADLTAYNHDVDRRDHLVNASTVLLAGALTLGAVGTLLYLVDNPHFEEPMMHRERSPGGGAPDKSEKPEMTAPSMSMWIGPGMAGASGRF